MTYRINEICKNVYPFMTTKLKEHYPLNPPYSLQIFLLTGRLPYTIQTRASRGARAMARVRPREITRPKL